MIKLSSFLIFFMFVNIIVGLVPIIVGSSVAAAVGTYLYNFGIKLPFCIYRECCTDAYITDDIIRLKYDLDTNLYGQHIIRQHLPQALKAHMNDKSPKKPLVMSLQGPTGTGKNYVSDFIVKNLYKYGYESNFVKKYSARVDFPLESLAKKYGIEVVNTIESLLSKCPRSLIIFDEVEKMPNGMFEALASLLNYKRAQSLEYNKAIFIFLSNVGGINISKQLIELTEKGVLRDKTKLTHYERILESASYNLPGGLRAGGPLELKVIDYFLPFLPLERQHVEECIKSEYIRQGYVPSMSEIKEVIDEDVFFEGSGLFAAYGCKGFEKKIGVKLYSKYQ